MKNVKNVKNSFKKKGVKTKGKSFFKSVNREIIARFILALLPHYQWLNLTQSKFYFLLYMYLNKSQSLDRRILFAVSKDKNKVAQK